MTQPQDITADLMARATSIKAGIAHLTAVNKTLIATLALARADLEERSPDPADEPTIQAIDMALALASREPEGLAKLNASEMAPVGART